MASLFKFYSFFMLCVLLVLNLAPRTYCEKQRINSLEILESLSQLALLRHHPQSMYSNNVTESFFSLLEDLRNQNLTADHSNVNCSSLTQYPLIPKGLCTDGALFKCMSANDMLELVPENTKSVGEALARLCPLLLLQLHSSACDSAGPSSNPSLKPSSAAVWGYGLLFVTVISCCSLVGVVMLPLLSKNIYHIVLMLFEGLAVGSLVGSSLFHLIPQTFKLVGKENEHDYLWRSLLIFGGIYLFYVSERFMKIIIDLRKDRKLKKSGYVPGDNSSECLKTVPEVNQLSINSSHLKIEDCEKEKMSTNGLPVLTTENLNNQNYKFIGEGNNKNKAVKSYPVNSEISLSHHIHHHEHTVHFEKGQSTIGTVAWMIIFGDGLHNFIDGLSIGAAFSESILAGVSISVAVICEEFPHELGDFAVLLSAGMTMRQALLYNFLSAITCYLGLVIGILLGDLAEGAPYIFALAAGMFLYIALVDMMGELSEALEEARRSGMRKQLKVFFIQNVGIILGFHYMDIINDEIHPHCLQCIRLIKCTAVLQPGESCGIINCPADCGARFHACKLQEHRLLCMNERVPCINVEYGCPSVMLRKSRSKHLVSCPASIIHCSEEWDRWPIHFHDKKVHSKNSLDSPLLSHLDVALALRDQRMLRRWCMAAAQGQSVLDQKFTISPSSSLWIFRKWHSSREYSYPPGLEQSVCNELCKSCKNNSSSGTLPRCQNTVIRTGTVLDSFCLDYNSLAEKENAGDSNNKQEKPENIINKEKYEPPLKNNKCVEQSNNIDDIPQYNLDDVLQLSQFGTIIYHQSSGEGSIRVAVDNTATNSDQENIACQILDFKFKNPSSTPPWCLPLGLDLNLESRSPHPPSYFMYTFLCYQEFRRDEYGWHYKNAHSEIHSGLNGWMVERCPLAQYGCKFARQRFSPSSSNSYVVYNDVLESFGVANKTVSVEDNISRLHSSKEEEICQNGYHDLNLTDLPFDVLQHIVRFLDSFSLSNLSLTSLLLRDVCSSVLKDRGLVHYKWEKHKKDGKSTWKTSKYKRWFFSSHFTPVHQWTFNDKDNMANHLKVCTFYTRVAPKYAFDYMKGPAYVHPDPEKCFSDPAKESTENTTKL